ncbi:MMPL family transporter [Mycobacterium camsae]|uniref:MMPL family transporter n=1 Tax=Mycobacterium gordonae TaxID=1778 RepID=UPI00197ECCBF|nr:MMPL family transporter [Mycobacterium gordonae]
MSRLVKQLLVVAAWIAVAVGVNVLAALASSGTGRAGTALPAPDAQAVAANNRIAQAFPGSGTDAIAYLVLDGRDPLGDADRPYYDDAVRALRADTAHVGSVLDWWSDPLMAPLGSSHDGRSGAAVIWLRGEAGSAKAAESLDAARSVIRALPSSTGLRARITVPTAVRGTGLRLAPWQSAVIVAAALLVAALLLLRLGCSSVAIAALTAGLCLAAAWPLAALFGLFSWTVAAVLMTGVIATSVLLFTMQERRGYRAMLPALAAPAAGVVALTAPLLLAQTPGVRAVGLAAPGVVVALGASLTLLPVLLAQNAASPAGSWGLPQSVRRTVRRPAAVVALVAAICALPVLGMHWGMGDAPVRTGSADFTPNNRLPDVVMVKSSHDLRDPAGLIAIDTVSRRLMEIPGVRKVQSAAWPAGVPWTDASLSSAAGRLSDQLDRQAATFVPQVTAVKTLGSVLDQVSGSVNALEASVSAGVGGLAQLQQAINSVVSGTRNIKDTAAEVSGYLDPVRGWMGGVQDCSADMLCSAARKAIDPFDRVIADVTVLSDGATRLAAGSARTTSALAGTPRAVAEMRSALDQLRSFVPTLQTTIESTIPQVVQLSAFLKNLSIDFADTGAGGFYLPRKALADPSYQHVRQTMFSADGTAARFLVYSDQTGVDLGATSHAEQIETAVGNATKYGSLVDSEVAVSGGAQLAAGVRGGVEHDAVLLALVVIAVATLAGMWRGALGGLSVALGIVGSFLAGLGVSVGVWQYLLHGSVDASAAPTSFAVLAACALPYLIAALVPVRRGAAPLAAAGGTFGAGLMLLGSSVALAQIGTVVLVGLVLLAAMTRLVDVHRLVPLRQRDLDRA